LTNTSGGECYGLEDSSEEMRAGGTDDLYTVLLQCGDERRYVGRTFGRRKLQRLRRLADLRRPEELLETAGRDARPFDRYRSFSTR
jgi:hypothetical protein